MRLNKFLADAGVASRRASDVLIQSGRVSVNGRVADTMGITIDPVVDCISVDGRHITAKRDHIYCLLNKPGGCLTTVRDPFHRQTVMTFVKDIPRRVFPVGRLDVDTEGLLLFTDDGDLGHALIHPRYAVEKEYEVLVRGTPTAKTLRMLETGVPIDGRVTSPARVSHSVCLNSGTRFSIVLHEGRKRQIRKMCAYIGYPVEQLRRVRLGPIRLGDLPTGRWRYLDHDEVRALHDAVGVGASGE